MLTMHVLPYLISSVYVCAYCKIVTPTALILSVLDTEIQRYRFSCTSPCENIRGISISIVASCRNSFVAMVGRIRKLRVRPSRREPGKFIAKSADQRGYGR